MRDCIDSIIKVLKSNSIEVNKNNLDEDLDIDSLTFISILLELEEKFSIEIDDEDLVVDNFKSLKDFEKLIEKYVNLKKTN